jgi:putative CocE/NonD family hydrolase
MTRLLFCLALVVANSASAGAFDVSWGIKIPMRDGIELNATVYQPVEQDGRLPVIFTMTPYISDSYHDRAEYFATQGYVFALVDVRGRGNSEGQFNPLANDHDDGFDVVQWLAEQDWSNGKITMWGGSYAGFNQWATASRDPENLATIVPVASPYVGVDFPFGKNIFYSYDIQWLTLTSGATGNSNLFGSDYWNQVYYRRYVDHRPFAELDRIAGNESTVFQTWIAHPSIDNFWRGYNPSEAQYARLEMPILSITGHHDGDQPGALAHYRAHVSAASRKGRKNHFLIMGPWNHSGTRTPQQTFGGYDFGAASLLDMNDLHRQWYDWTLKDGERPAFLKNQVAYYVVGPDEWRYADALDEIADDTLSLYLDSNGSANDVFSSGNLRDEPVATSQPDRYRYDPLDVSFGKLELEASDAYLLNQSWPLNMAGLVYHSAPLAETVTLAGQMRFEVWMAIDQPDTDFAVGVYEIRTDGISVWLGSDLLRARYRNSGDRPEPVPANEPQKYVFDGFAWNAQEIRQGSRLRLHLTSPNSIHLQKNYNSGGDVSQETADDARTVTVTVFHDSQWPARLDIPLDR